MMYEYRDVGKDCGDYNSIYWISYTLGFDDSLPYQSESCRCPGVLLDIVCVYQKLAVVIWIVRCTRPQILGK